ncbi:Deoxyxylulose-5-phosphate synthase protein [Dioscorea alata]|uniref:Deoxyxylulose-5-phosphate synthase protein n=2 Tax=Dioscorea alata TaxID=55571 RepID=A0ACB7W2G5_DIOAL|nr:Deoxyxylulose-5-phosphate synthase protein [Dioscorea alata]
MGLASASSWSHFSLRSRLFLHSECSLQQSKFYFFEVAKQLKDEIFKTNLHTESMSSYSRKGLCGQVAALPDADDFFSDKAPTPILDMVDTPIHLKNLSIKELKQLAEEICSEISFIMSKSGPPFKASLAVVELTIAIHYVFNAPVDKILWDIGDQTYAHKILTGRRSLMHTIMQKNGISGFTSRRESEYDAFGAGHGCNSISAGLGMAVARDIKGKKDRVVTVISNWSTMAGQVYEAMGNAGYLDSNMVVILNDSRHSLHPKQEEGVKPTINALSSTLSKLQSSKSFRRFREAAKVVTKRIGKGMHEWAAKFDEFARGMVVPLGATLFEELGLYYIGPVDGTSIEDLICVLNEVASLDSTGPVLIHVITEAEQGLADITNGTLNSGLLASPDTVSCKLSGTFNDCLVKAIIAEAEKDKDIVVVHAGMGIDASLNLFQSKFPERIFDVGMAEQHAVTFAAGLSCGGLKPFCIIPSTFLQRAYDQIIEDVDLQNVPVRFAVTSAGLVGPDGPTKCGAFDIAFMACLPNMIVMAPADEDELISMVGIAANTNDRPVCFRCPGVGSISGIFGPLCSVTPIEVGKGEILVEGRDVALLGYGVMVQNCIKAQSLLAELNIQVTVANARFCKPLDIELVRKLCREHEFLITVEEGSIGGFGSHVAQFIALDGLLDGRTKWRPIVLPDNYIEHGTLIEQLDTAGLSGHHIAATALRLLGRNREALMLLR